MLVFKGRNGQTDLQKPTRLIYTLFIEDLFLFVVVFLMQPGAQSA